MVFLFYLKEIMNIDDDDNNNDRICQGNICTKNKNKK